MVLKSFIMYNLSLRMNYSLMIVDYSTIVSSILLKQLTQDTSNAGELIIQCEDWDLHSPAGISLITYPGSLCML